MEEDKILCTYNNNLIIASFDGGDGGADYYANYQDGEVIAENINSDYGILITDFGEKFQLLENSWDGFQPSELDGIDALKEIIKLAKYIP